MAIKANASITLSTVVDVKATYRYYLLQSSTLSKPAVPTTYPPAKVALPQFTNLVESASFDNSIFSSLPTSDNGYVEDWRWSSSSAAFKAEPNLSIKARVTGAMPFKSGGVYRLKYLCSPANTSGAYAGMYGYIVWMLTDGTIQTQTVGEISGCIIDQGNAYMQFTLEKDSVESFFISGYKHDDPPIITCNEEIVYDNTGAWNDTEPSYTEGSTNSLYFVDCTVFCDGTWQYSPVSLSSSYEAAKVAYNKAQNAQSTADSANEKIDSTAEEINRTMTEQNTSIIRSCEEILFTALESYIETSNYEEFKSTAETQLKVLADSLAIQVSELSQRITEVNGDLQTKFEQVTTYFTFDVDGLTIGKVDNPYKVIIDNERYSMTVNGVEVLWMDATTGEVHTPKLTITERFTLLGYVIDMDDDGNVNCEYAGGDV